MIEGKILIENYVELPPDFYYYDSLSNRDVTNFGYEHVTEISSNITTLHLEKTIAWTHQERINFLPKENRSWVFLTKIQNSRKL